MTDESEEKMRLRVISTKAAILARDLLIIKGLYSSIDTSDEIGAVAEQKLRTASIGTFDCYCTKCRKETSFIVSAMPVPHTGGGLRNGNALANPPTLFALRAVCQRDLTSYLYVFHKAEKRVLKIGQAPSMADISFGELQGIDSSVDPLDRKELGTAIGLFAHDAASGAFVYLRRVFERMIARAHTKRIEAGGDPIADFDKMRVDEKVGALAEQLPERAVRNRAVFSVLSAGIHELTDEQCLALFPVVKAVIFQMLEEEEHMRKKQIAEREADAAFQALLSNGFGSAATAGDDERPQG
ncbi:hypothetical protein [Sphingopyxis granuli]|uniref:hypothetical protein n=1 Tax=Sphingopyxis granuli TaxID=267128 RepID=UPI000AED1B6C|nr:hypothetical protein [Sphingopyxis granuli]